MTGPGPQDRSERLYQLMASSQWDTFVGKTTRDIADLLGRPDRVMTLRRDGVTWMRIIYVCDRLPAGVTAEERDAFTKGWRFSPSLLFRDGVVVPEEQFDQEVPAPG